ncbi:MAG: molybdopterin-dependent oxidoreductase, partial [Trebonia sp.]
MTPRTGFPRWWGAVSGLLAAAAAMGIGQLFAGFTIPAASPVVAVGEAAIDRTPLAVKDWATSTFGTADKTVLLGGVLIVVFLYSMLVGVLAMRRLSLGFAGLAIFAGIGLAAALTRHDATGSYAVPTIFGALAGAVALWWLVVTARQAAVAGQAGRAGRAPVGADRLPPIAFDPGDHSAAGAEDAGDDDARVGWVPAGSPAGPGTGGDRADRPPAGETGPYRAGPPVPRPAPARTVPAWPTARRNFLVAGGVSIAAAGIGYVGGRSLSERKSVSLAQASLRFPKAAEPTAPLPAGVNLPVPGISPFITPNGQFYRVDTAILIPQVDPSNWTLRIHGMVAREITITFDELLHRPLIEDYLTLCCVSDPVGGPYIGNAKWLGASLAALIREARPRGGADQLLATSADGYTSGTPLSVVLDGRDALLAVAMNGAALPTAHGFPARLVVPGLYGYVSACKWVVDLKVTTFAAKQGYWVPRGWSQLGP